MTSFYVYETQYEPEKGAVGVREIKFRAWGEDYGGMLSDVFIRDGVWDMLNEFLEHTDDVVFMQYTGLKDKDGVEIYEGDVLSSVAAFQKETGHVVFDGGSFSLVILSSRTTGIGSKYFLSTCKELEVVGNVHDNPELLEVTD